VADFIINDSTTSDDILLAGQRGLDLSDRPEGFAYGGTAEPFPSELIIPRSEWQARIEERKARKRGLRYLTRFAGLKCKDQGQTNYCWINAPAYCCEIVRIVQNQLPVTLSPASGGAQIKGYRNVGGWGKEALEFISKSGLVPIEKWPANAIDRRYATPENLRLALKYRVDEWWELQPRNLDHLISCLFRDTPVACGYNWWRHETTAIDVDWLDGEVVTINDNSWGPSYGDQGRFNLQGSRMLGDDMVAPRTVKAS